MSENLWISHSGGVWGGWGVGGADEHKQRAVVLDNERATFVSASDKRRATMNDESVTRSENSVFLFPVRRPSTTHSPTHSPTLPPTSAERRECAPSLEQRRDKVAKITSVHSRARTHTHTQRGNIQLCFQHLPSKAQGVTSLEKTRG